VVDASPGAVDVTLGIVLVAGTWGALAGAPIVAWSRRRAVAARVQSHAAPVAASRRAAREWGPVGRVVRGLLRRRAAARADLALLAALPSAFDVLVAAVGAGCAPIGAVELEARWGPAPVACEFARVLTATELGASLGDALTALRTARPLLAPMADVLIASAELGSPAAPALVRLADEARAAARRRAEARARVLPVKLLFPLVFLVLPAFVSLTVAPALIAALERL
jgi:tight adherence protein C